MTHVDLPLIFALLAAFGVAIYVLADGFDLGVGILFLVAPREVDRDIMMESIEPVWDANETWLVFGGTLLFAAFPVAYYVLLPAFYLPLMLMLFALIFRGVAFAFRAQTVRYRRVWDFAFSGGSILATFAQGLVLGAFIGGVNMENGMFHGGAFDFLSVLGILCGIGLVGGYALLAAGWLIWKTEGSTQVFAREIGHSALIATSAMMAIVSAWTAYSQPEVAARWFSWPNIAWLAPIPLFTAALVVATWRALWGVRETRVFWLSIGIFLLGFVGLAISIWPYVVPRHITIWNGASDPQTLSFVGVGLAIILPVVLAYQFHAYWVFRGKTTAIQESDPRDLTLPMSARRTCALDRGPHLS
jgi:cytochrome d ubiquinol oxidase subunit II